MVLTVRTILLAYGLKALTEIYWNETVSKYLRSWQNLSISELHKCTHASDVIREFACNVLVHLAASNGIKKFTPRQIMGHDLRPGLSIHIDDGKVLRHVNFGIYMKEWSLESYLPHPESLPYMTDGFWADIAALSTMGQVELFESCPVDMPPGMPKKFKGLNKSIVFQLARNILFRMQCEPHNAHDVGILITKFPIETPFVELLDGLRSAYGIYHRCISQLVKHGTKRNG